MGLLSRGNSQWRVQAIYPITDSNDDRQPRGVNEMLIIPLRLTWLEGFVKRRRSGSALRGAVE